MKTKSTLNLVAALAVIWLSGCSKSDTEAAKSAAATNAPVPAPKALTKTSLTASKNIWSTLPLVAKQQGFFKQEGLDVQINYVQAAKLAMDALVANSTDFANVVDPNIAFLAFSGNKDVVVIGTIVKSHDSAIVARKSAGITSAQDLKGKKLGVLQGTTSQIFAERFLEKNGLRYADVQAQNLQPVAIQTALTEKAIDAGSVWQPFVHNLQKQLGDDALVFTAPDAYIGYMNVAVRKEWAGKNEATVVAYIRALRKAEAFVAKNTDAAQALVGTEVNLAPDIVKSIWSQYEFGLGLDKAALQKVVTEEGQWIKRTQPGFESKEVPDYAGYFDDRFIR